MAEQVDAEVKGIFEEALGRYKMGEQTYGVFDKDTDLRDFLKEAEEEMLDVMVYMAFEIARARGLHSRLDSVHAQLSRRLTGGGKDGMERQARINEAAREAWAEPSQRITDEDLEGLKVKTPRELHYEPFTEKEER